MTTSAIIEALDSAPETACNDLGQTVARRSNVVWTSGESELHRATGERKYLNRAERNRYLAQAHQLEPSKALFALVLAWTGARVSEVLALTPASFQVEANFVTIVTLKRRKPSIRQVPLPPGLMQRLDRFFGLRRMQRLANVTCRLWSFCRETAWRITKRLMQLAGIVGCRACPRGLRHSFGVATLQSGVPIHLIQRWMGHARLSSTMIYMSVCGPEEIGFAKRFWRSSALGSERYAA